MQGDELPDPLVPPDHDVSMLSDFRLNVDRLLASELVAVGTAEECWAALMLWCRAWKQVPGGSLPNDERTLAGFSGAGSRWKRVREVALRGFVLCSDGRLYHRFLCEEVRRAYKSHVSNVQRRDADRKRLSEWREKRGKAGDETLYETRHETTKETVDETRFVAEEPEPEPEPISSLRSDISDANASARADKAACKRGPPSQISQQMLDIWADEVRGLLGIPTRMPKETAKKAVLRLKDSFGGDLGEWRRYCQRIAASPHLRGENDRGWQANFGWVLEPKNLVKIENGNYDDHRKTNAIAYERPIGPAPSPEELWGDDGE